MRHDIFPFCIHLSYSCRHHHHRHHHRRRRCHPLSSFSATNHIHLRIHIHTYKEEWSRDREWESEWVSENEIEREKTRCVSLIAKVKHFSIFIFIFNFYLHYALCLIISFCFVFYSTFLSYSLFFEVSVLFFCVFFFCSFISLVFCFVFYFFFQPTTTTKNVAYPISLSAREISFIRLFDLHRFCLLCCFLLSLLSFVFHITINLHVFSYFHHLINLVMEVLICLLFANFFCSFHFLLLLILYFIKL